MSIAPTEEVTRILQEWNHGDANAAARLMPLVYEELRRRAAEYPSETNEIFPDFRRFLETLRRDTRRKRVQETITLIPSATADPKTVVGIRH